jgi:hypothetical protein
MSIIYGFLLSAVAILPTFWLATYSEIGYGFLLLALFLLPLIMPWWKFFLGSTIMITAFFSTIWIQHCQIASQDNYTGSPGDGLGLVFFMFAMLLFIISIFVKVVTKLVAIQMLKKCWKNEDSI